MQVRQAKVKQTPQTLRSTMDGEMTEQRCDRKTASSPYALYGYELA
jgi:hypothetical protein